MPLGLDPAPKNTTPKNNTPRKEDPAQVKSPGGGNKVD